MESPIGVIDGGYIVGGLGNEIKTLTDMVDSDAEMFSAQLVDIISYRKAGVIEQVQ